MTNHLAIGSRDRSDHIPSDRRTSVTKSPARDALVEELWFAFRQAERTLHDRTRVGIAAGGMTFPRVTILRILVHGGPASSTSLAEALGVTTANLPGLLDKLEADGLVSRTRDRTDKRVVHVAATASGRKMLSSLWRAAMQELGRGFEDWTERDLQSLVSSLARIGGARCGPGCLAPLPMLRPRAGKGTKRRTGRKPRTPTDRD